MPRKADKKKFDFSAFLSELKTSAVGPPTIGTKAERRYFLIVTEGLRTEPLYFEYWQRKLPRHLLETIKVVGEGDNTVNIVKKAIALRDERNNNPHLPPYDEVWAVFDKDDFPNKRYHEAIDLAGQYGIESGHSNQSFELWYVLHFEYLQSALHRSDYITKLSRQLGSKYVKNNKKVVDTIMNRGDVKQAIEFAVKLEELHGDTTPAACCPSTRVYVLVERLLSYLENRPSRY